MNPAADATLVEVSSNYRHSTQPRSPSCAVVSAKSFQARSSSMLPFPWDRARMLAGVGSHRGFIRNASTSQGWLETHWDLIIATLGASPTRGTFHLAFHRQPTFPSIDSHLSFHRQPSRVRNKYQRPPRPGTPFQARSQNP